MLKWSLDALLGVGGMAAVYAATHKNRSRVALKVLHRELASNQDIRDRFMREAYVANSVKHPGAVQVLDDHMSEEGEPFLVMELLEGSSLEELQTQRGLLSAGVVLDYADQILDVLAAAHDRQIIHRDIKPQNLFLTTEGRIKVLDFGIARILEGAASATVTGSLLGTPAFMPPEQAGGRTSAVCAASDLWAVGATMFTLLTGRFVHEAENAQAHMVKAAVTPARSLKTLLPEAPSALVRLVDHSLSYEIAERWQDARKMQEAVRRAKGMLLPNLVSDDGDDEDEQTRAMARGGLRAVLRQLPARTAPRVAEDEHTTTEEEDEQTPAVNREGVRAILAQKGHRGAKPAAPQRQPDAATSVMVVPAPVFQGARASRPEAPPAPPPPPEPAAQVAKPLAAPVVPSSPAAASGDGSLDSDETQPIAVARQGAVADSQARSAQVQAVAPMEAGPFPPAVVEPADPRTEAGSPARPVTDSAALWAATPPSIQQTIPFGAVVAYDPAATDDRGRSSALPEAPVFGAPPPPPAARASSPGLEVSSLLAPTFSPAAAPPPPEVISVAAQSISQAIAAPKPGRSRLGTAEKGAVAGALLAILIVAIVVIRAVLGSDSPPSGAGVGVAPPLVTAQPSVEPAPVATAAPSGADSSSGAAAGSSSAAPSSSATATGSATAEPSSAPAREGAPQSPWKPANPGETRWRDKTRKLAPKSP